MAITTIKGTPFSATAVGTDSTTATFSAPSSTSLLYITDISASSDLGGAIVQVSSGSTVIWQAILPANSTTSHQFASPLACVAGEDAVINVTGTAAGAANIAGYYL